ncbi:transposase-like protein [Ensifer mexicanus]|nr:transposase-like protein [Sinorhizobium mexicanum]
MARHRSHSIEFKRQVVQEFIAGETLHGLAKRHDVSRNLIRIWVRKYEEGAFDDDAQAATGNHIRLHWSCHRLFETSTNTKLTVRQPANRRKHPAQRIDCSAAISPRARRERKTLGSGLRQRGRLSQKRYGRSSAVMLPARLYFLFVGAWLASPFV